VYRLIRPIWEVGALLKEEQTNEMHKLVFN